MLGGKNGAFISEPHVRCDCGTSNDCWFKADETARLPSGIWRPLQFIGESFAINSLVQA
jgi:hypothetical protein